MIPARRGLPAIRKVLYTLMSGLAATNLLALAGLRFLSSDASRPSTGNLAFVSLAVLLALTYYLSLRADVAGKRSSTAVTFQRSFRGELAVTGIFAVALFITLLMDQPQSELSSTQFAIFHFISFTLSFTMAMLLEVTTMLLGMAFLCTRNRSTIGVQSCSASFPEIDWDSRTSLPFTVDDERSDFTDEKILPFVRIEDEKRRVDEERRTASTEPIKMQGFDCHYR